MELSRLLSALRRFWWIVFLSVAVAAATSYFATRATPFSYLSHTSLLVGDAGGKITDQDIVQGRTLAQFYAALVQREPVLKATLQALKLPWDWQALRDRVTATSDPLSPLIEISVIDTDPQRAKIFADEIARQLILTTPGAPDPQKASEREFTLQQIQSLQTKIKNGNDQIRALDDQFGKVSSRQQIEELKSQQAVLETQITTWTNAFAQLQANLLIGNPNAIKVIEPATVPTEPVGPKLVQNVVVAGLVGLVLAVLAILVMELLDDTLKTTDDARRMLGLPVLGSVARFGGTGYASRLVSASPEYSRVAEAYRVMRTNLQFSTVNHSLHTLMVTSSKPKEGKSTTAANLATIISQSGTRVILVDADLRRPVQHEVFELDNERGLTTAFIEDNVAIDKLLRPITADSLSVLPSGPIPHNPAELLDSPRMLEILDELKQHADLVIIDTPPMLSVADATILASRVDGVLLVVDSGYTRSSLAKRSVELLQGIGAHMMGVVVNRAATKVESDYYDYDYSPRKKSTGSKTKKEQRGVTLKRPQPKPELVVPSGTGGNSGNVVTANAKGSNGAFNGTLKPVRLGRPNTQANDGANGNGNGKSSGSSNGSNGSNEKSK